SIPAVAPATVFKKSLRFGMVSSSKCLPVPIRAVLVLFPGLGHLFLVRCSPTPSGSPAGRRASINPLPAPNCAILVKAGRTGKSRVVHGLHDRPQMHLADFIKGNMERLLEEWEGFARSLGATSGMSREELRNWAEEMLTAIAEEIATQQSQDEQARKSRGRAPEHGPELSRSARAHASERLAQGFNLK